MVLWWNAESVLLALRQPPDAAALAARYCRRIIVSLPAFLAFEALRRFCQVQGVVRPMLIVSVAADALHPLWCWLYIYKLKFGFVGAGASLPYRHSFASLPHLRSFDAYCFALCSAWATVTSYTLMFVLMLAYLKLFRPHTAATWQGWSTEMFTVLGSYVKLAIPGTLMGCLGWWSFEVIAIAAGTFGTIVPVNRCFSSVLYPSVPCPQVS